MSSANYVGSAAAGEPAVGAPALGDGRVLAGRYALGSPVGRGGEGDTYRAHDRVTGQPVAVKVFRSTDAALNRRVSAEFEKLMAMDHPGVVRALDVGRHDGHLFLVTDFVPGESLATVAYIADEARRRSVFARAAREVTDALAYLHGRGVLHGDLSPDNVRMAADGRSVLIDLGGWGAGGWPSTGGAIGTLGFAAPEALIGRISTASDLFSLGATMFHAWTGHAPFGVGAASVAKMLSTSAPVLSSVRVGLAPGWDALIADLLQPTPEARLSSARVALRQMLALEPWAPLTTTTVYPAVRSAVDSGQARPLDTLSRPPDEPSLLPPHPAGDPLAGIFVGRTTERALLRQTFEALAEGASPYAAVVLAGREGSGRGTLVELALRDLAVAQLAEATAPLSIFRGSWEAVLPWLGLTAANLREPTRDEDPLRAQQRLFAAVAAALDARGKADPVVVALASGWEARGFAAFVAGAPAAGRWLVIVSAPEPISGVSRLELSLPALTSEEIRALVTRAAGEDAPSIAVARIAEASGGHPATVAVLARQLVEAIRRGNAPTFAPRPEMALDQILRQSFEELPPGARRLVATVALGIAAPGRSSSDQSLAEQAAEAAGWLTRAVEVETAATAAASELPPLRLPSASHQTVFRTLLRAPHPDVRAVAAEALLAPQLLGDAIRAACLEACGQHHEAAAAFLTAAERPSADAPAASKWQWLEHAERLSLGCLNVQQRTGLATIVALRGDVEQALVLLDVALTTPARSSDGGTSVPRIDGDGDRLQLVERKAWLLGRAARLQEASGLLRDELANAPPAAPAAPRERVRARLARILVSLGRFSEASAAAADCATAVDIDTRLLATEAAILAHAYSGELATARRLLAGAPPAAASLPGAGTQPPLTVAPHAPRFLYLSALLDHLGGDLQAALATYRLALKEAEGAGDVHTVAAIALNVGALAAESGRFDEALTMQDRAIRELGRLGARAELGNALFNAGMTLLELGDLAGVRQVVSRLRAQPTSLLPSSTPAWGPAAATYLDAELAVRQGDQPAALESFSLASTAPALDPATRRAALLARAELLGKRGSASEATAILDQLAHDRPSPAQSPPSYLPAGEGGDASADPRQAAELRLARARLALGEPALDLAVALRLAGLLQEDAATAAREGRRPRAWRAALIAARLFHRADDTKQAAVQIIAAKRLLEEIRMSTPVDHRSGLDDDPDARFLNDLARMTATTGEHRGPPPSDGRGSRAGSRVEDRLRRLLRINKRLNSELRLPRLLELIMDTVIELTEAERGFILLEDEKGELAVKVARNIDQQTLETGAFEISRSIARQAAAGGAPIVTIDAAGDPRFREALSVTDLHLRSVLAVPLQAKGRAVGTLYVDNRLRKGAFDDDDVQLVLDFSEQAGIAIENARLLAELRRRERQIEVLNRRLQNELAVRKEELVGMKQELRENRQALAIRYDYRNIIGRTPRMLELFRLLDRLTDTALPVVIQGESGTGKELVARALHFNGPRRDRPFVSENCAAIPETLLESTLFGSVRGAYTGADHDTRGLFEVADGGTLFLDEVGEMSPAMQGKLLRVLQTGELRRVGSERIRKVEVRIIAATNRDLGRMVEEGRFRQDLFFRLSVAPIALPPLRERREDIPAMVEHVLGKLAARINPAPPPKRITAAALARLAGYRWPGNVRELENELMRATALCDGHIDVADLSPHIAGDAESALTTLDDPDSLALRPRVERLERALLREALARSGGNQTRAAVALGLSRFGLQKKMQRFKMG